MSNNRSLPINQFPLWKNCLIVIVLALALFYALPNVFGKRPTLQISQKDGNVSTQLIKSIEDTLILTKLYIKELSYRMIKVMLQLSSKM
ncbi:hypothetical protein ACP8HZ_02905 [Francisella noatunensis]